MPGDHPSLLAKQIDVDRLEAQIAELRSQRQADATLIRQLQGFKSEYSAYSVNAAAPGATVATVWTKLPMPALLITGDGFRQNADNTITVLRDGLYVVAAGISNAGGLTANQNAQGAVWTASDDTSPVNPSTMIMAGEAGAGTSAIVVFPMARVIRLAAGTRLGTAVYNRLGTATFQTTTFSIARIGAGPVGPRGPQGGVLDIQTKFGSQEAYSGTFSTPFVPLHGNVAQTSPMRLVYTPPVDAWWEVTGLIGIVQAISVAYNYAYGAVYLSPFDVDGVSGAQVLVTQHAQVNTYEQRLAGRIFKLAAGVTYTADLGISPGGGNWNYYCGMAQLYIGGKAWAR